MPLLHDQRFSSGDDDETGKQRVDYMWLHLSTEKFLVHDVDV